jgi:Metallo-peptidase family M12/Secretion system C-terminal sorting domain
MQKQILLFVFLCLSFLGQSQALKPIAEMVRAAHEGTSPNTMSLFASRTDGIAAYANLAKGLSDGLVLHWDANLAKNVREMAESPITLQIPDANGQIWTLDLVPARNFSDEFAVHHAATGLVAEVDRGSHFWGIVKGDNNSLASISVFDNEVIGMISTDRGNWVLGIVEKDAQKAHVLYNTADLKEGSGFECLTDEKLHRLGEQATSGTMERSSGPSNCVRMFVETDYTLFQNKGSVANVTSYMTGVFSQVSLLYTNEQINLVLHDLFVWSTNDPYPGPTASNYLNQFRTAKNGVFNGDLAHFVGIHNLGGVAYLDVLCFPSYGVGYSSINATYSNVPTYSWTVEVLTHEIGHNLGSSHTHACVWNGNNTAIDGCGPTAGYSEGCTAALPSNGGTIMSYCHLVSGVGINFNNGFGPQPGNLIRNEVYNAPCLAACGGGGGTCTYAVVNTNNFESSFGSWTDGGTDCIRTNNATYANSPTYSIQLRDNTSTSVMSTTSQNWAAYTKIKVDFSYITVSFENGEDFWLQLSTNGGTNYTTVATYTAGSSFSNGVRQNVSFEINGPFTASTRLRFRADASADDDQVYIDDVVISACTQQLNGGVNDERNALQTAGEESVHGFQVNPNPASEWLNVTFVADADMPVAIVVTDIAGRNVLNQYLSAVRGQNNYQIPVERLENGVYFLRTQVGNQQFVQKVMISK